MASVPDTDPVKESAEEWGVRERAVPIMWLGYWLVMIVWNEGCQEAEKARIRRPVIERMRASDWCTRVPNRQHKKSREGGGGGGGMAGQWESYHEEVRTCGTKENESNRRAKNCESHERFWSISGEEGGESHEGDESCHDRASSDSQWTELTYDEEVLDYDQTKSFERRVNQ
jgi:hypothetical protein